MGQRKVSDQYSWTLMIYLGREILKSIPSTSQILAFVWILFLYPAVIKKGQAVVPEPQKWLSTESQFLVEMCLSYPSFLDWQHKIKTYRPHVG